MIGILKLADEKGYNINNLKAGVLKKINEKDNKKDNVGSVNSNIQSQNNLFRMQEN